jgi:hypothetical protein
MVLLLLVVKIRNFSPLINLMFERAIKAFDDYNAKDPNYEAVNGVRVSKELLYAQRMSDKLFQVKPDASEHLKLAARCQHIGRWEIPRSAYSMDRNGYLKWRGQLKVHHAKIAERILKECGYEEGIISNVKSLLMKKQGEEVQLMEDIICLVFIEYYLPDFAIKHEEEKVIDIVMKTMKKMSHEGILLAGKLPIDENMVLLLQKAANKLA